MIDNSANESNVNASMGTTIIHTGSNQAQLPRITLPRFNGDHNDWRSFHDLFVSLVHNNSQLPPVQKLHYLKGCLIGDVEKLLKHTPITGDDYGPAWDKVKARFENKRILINTQLRILTNIPKATTESSNGLKMLVDTAEGCLQQLKILGENVSSWDTLVIYLLVQKLPLLILRLWEEELKDIQTMPDLNQFKKFIQTRYQILESIAQATNSVQKVNAKNSTVKNSTQTYHATSNSKCPACNKEHYIAKCERFLSMSIPARQRVIKASGRCFNCFSHKHTHQACNSKHTCLKCNKSHHTLLHLGERVSDF